MPANIKYNFVAPCRSTAASTHRDVRWPNGTSAQRHNALNGLASGCEGVKGLDKLMTTTWDRMKPKEVTSPVPTPPAVRAPKEVLGNS